MQYYSAIRIKIMCLWHNWIQNMLVTQRLTIIHHLPFTAKQVSILALLLHTIAVIGFTSLIPWLNVMYLIDSFSEKILFPSLTHCLPRADCIRFSSPFQAPSQKYSALLLFGHPILNTFTKVATILS